MKPKDMKKKAIISVFLLCTLISCTGKKTQNKNEAITDIGTNYGSSENTDNNEYLYIGGLRYNHKLSELGEITEFRLELHPWDKESSNNLEGIELLTNLTELDIRGARSSRISEEDDWQDISEIDFSPLKSLKKLKELEIYYVKLNKIPDLSEIPSLESIDIWSSKIMSLSGIEKANQIKQLKLHFWNIFLDDFAVLSTLKELELLSIQPTEYGVKEMEKYIFHVSDLSGTTGLKYLDLGLFSTIDLSGIKNLRNLEYLDLSHHSNIINIQELAWLRNLQKLNDLNIPTPETSLSFLTPLTNLTELYLYGSDNTIDIELLKNMVNLNQLMLDYFSIINFHILDTLPKLDNVMTYNSKFIPENNNRLKYAMVSYEEEPP